MVEVIHHYCSARVFLSIIKNKEIWLTSLSQSNDHMEGTWALNKWADGFRRPPKSGGEVRRRGAKFLVEQVILENVALGMCFSEEGDLLSQWRGYADDGAGFSVAFDRERLEELIDSSESNLKLSFESIAYGYEDYDRISEVFSALYGAFGEDIDKYRESSNGFGTVSVDNMPTKRDARREAVRKLFTIKNKAFAEEKEWRVLAFGPAREMEGLDFRENRSVLSPFLKLKIPPKLIRGVRLGPTNKTPYHMLNEALRVNGVTCPVDASNASYRSN